MGDHLKVDTSEIQVAFDDVFDQAIVFYGFADHMRDYDILDLSITTWMTDAGPSYVLACLEGPDGRLLPYEQLVERSPDLLR